MIGSSSQVRVEVLVTSPSNTQSPWVSVSSQSVSRPASAVILNPYLIAHPPDTGAEKKALVMKLGAEKWVDFKETKDLVKDIVDATDGFGAHAAVVTAANPSAYAQAVDYLRMGGVLMVVGLPARANLSADIFFTVIKSISILGSYVGNRQDAREALDIAARGKVKCYFELKPLSALAEYVFFHSLSLHHDLTAIFSIVPTRHLLRARSSAASSST